MRARDEKIAIVRASLAKRENPPAMSDNDCLQLYRRVQRDAARGTLVPNERTPHPLGKGKQIPLRGHGALKRERAAIKRARKVAP